MNFKKTLAVIILLPFFVLCAGMLICASPIILMLWASDELCDWPGGK